MSLVMSKSGGEILPLKFEKRLKLIQKWVTLRGAKVLDGGLGARKYQHRLRELGAEVTGVEHENKNVIQQETYNYDNESLTAGNLLEIDSDDSIYDIVLLDDIIQHSTNQHGLLQEVWRVLKPGGKLFIFAPNRFHPFETNGYIDANGVNTGAFRTFGMPYFSDGNLPTGLKAWTRNYWPSELKELTSRFGFQLVAHSYVWETFENNLKHQHTLKRVIFPYLSLLLNLAEAIPFVREIGASQVVVVAKPITATERCVVIEEFDWTDDAGFTVIKRRPGEVDVFGLSTPLLIAEGKIIPASKKKRQTTR